MTPTTFSPSSPHGSAAVQPETPKSTIDLSKLIATNVNSIMAARELFGNLPLPVEPIGDIFAEESREILTARSEECLRSNMQALSRRMNTASSSSSLTNRSIEVVTQESSSDTKRASNEEQAGTRKSARTSSFPYWKYPNHQK